MTQKAKTKTFVPAVQAIKNNKDKKAAKIFLDGGVRKQNFLESLRSMLPNEDRMVISNTSHGLAFTNPEALNQAVLQFIDKQEQGSE